MEKGNLQTGNDAADTQSEGEYDVVQQQPQTGESNRGITGDPRYYYQQQFNPIPYGYHLIDEQWVAQEQMMQQQGYQPYPPNYG